MSVSLPFIIRDGLEADVAACIALDPTYETDLVWQVLVERDDPHYYQVTFKTERLPRTLSARYPVDERLLRLSVPSEHCFLVAAERDSASLLGYLVMSSLPSRSAALLQELVVDRAFRRNHVGTRLLQIARRWAREQGLRRLLAEVNTRNYPAVAFCQASGLAFCGYNERYFDNQEIAVFFGQSLR